MPQKTSLLLLLLILFFKISYSQSQEIQIMLTPDQSIQEVYISPTSLYKKGEMGLDSIYFAGIPKELQSKIIKYTDFQLEQTLYEEYMRSAPSMPVEFLNRVMSQRRLDTSGLSKKPIKHRIFYLVGLTKNQKKVIIPDANNNYDFADDKHFLFEETVKEKKIPEIIVRFQYAYNKKVYSISEKILLYSTPGNFTYKDSLEQKLYLMIGRNNCRIGEFILNGIKYKAHVYSSNTSFKQNGLRILITDSHPINEDNSKLEEYQMYRLEDTINLANHLYKISNISVFGDSLFLSYLGHSTFEQQGLDSGKIAYDISSIDINNDTVNLRNLQGKFILLDFWGTWCGPCIASIPDLVKLSEVYKDTLQVISIALDAPSKIKLVKKIISEQKMDWLHIMEDDTLGGKQPIISKFRVTSYPTQILIDPARRIILRVSGIDGIKKIETKLEEFIQKR